jgi:hypothetical protein
MYVSYRHTSFATKKVSYSNDSQTVESIILKEQKNVLDRGYP